MKFCTAHAHDSERIISILKENIGKGCLYDEQKFIVVPDANWQVAAGNYTSERKFVMPRAAMPQGATRKHPRAGNNTGAR